PGGSSEVPDWVKKVIPFTPLLLIPLLGGIAGSSGTPVVPGSSDALKGNGSSNAGNGAGNTGNGTSNTAPNAGNSASAPASNGSGYSKGVSKATGLANTGVSGVTAAFALAIMAMIAGLGVLVLRRKNESE
ncbi:LPXTG cell wall anchor domain-containing protein, partial [Corynebacterium sp. HS2168-gen11]|uniref:LPXTG cell wall anchor domain-containing protein n=1 Tax=Corynebacterium sp. HS2168-gen11 TaxID=2974027 RepID=UPI00286ED46D